MKTSMFCTMALAALLLVGCGDEPTTTTPPPPAPAPAPSGTVTTPPAGTATAETTVKPMDEYRAEATNRVTAENAEAELNKLEQEIAGDR